MTYAFFGGCKISHDVPHYETSVRSVLQFFDIPLTDAPFTCCGYPMRHQDSFASIFSSARNMALAGQKGVDIMTLCQCCFGQLMFAAHRLKTDEVLRNAVNSRLAVEGLTWDGDIRIRHLLSVLHEDIGMEKISKMITNPLTGVRLAAHYGCHALRPGHIVRMDNPLAPTIFEDLIRAIGAEPVDWGRRLECCGHPLWEKNNGVSLYLMKAKIQSAVLSGAHAICTACNYCQIQFETVRQKETNDMEGGKPIPAILYIQMLA
ncbi:MAG: CoB--CoM heterodisulfide reductase iron-sulfur subunit B family protein, partial [Proteobacteria bacterium]|nr:CoB--CoM heterodisulfide reductase iron-sulfur subunit B family protein [Pseudomonadota bacterium]